MIFKQNLAAILADAGQAAWKKNEISYRQGYYPCVCAGQLRDFLTVVSALTNHESMSSPPGTLVANLD